jgi:hypothetical protein
MGTTPVPGTSILPERWLLRHGADGLRYVDHIVALRLPIDRAQSDVSAPVMSVRAHSDLHVFAAKAGE